MAESLKTLFVDQLSDLYDAEKQLTNAMAEMSKSATSQNLAQAFGDHLGQTRGHVERLDQVFKSIGENPTGKKCVAMEGLIQEGNDALKKYNDDEVRDAALIAAAQRVEHYEMAGYGTVRTYAKMLGYEDAANTLQMTLDEEGATDHKLNEIAVGGIFSKGVDQKAVS